MTVIWSLEALFDVADLRDYIAVDNPDAARRVAIAIVKTVEEGLVMNPKLGHPGRVPGTRELVMPKMPFIVPYRIRKTTLEVLGVYHIRRIRDLRSKSMRSENAAATLREYAHSFHQRTRWRQVEIPLWQLRAR
jgi:plasmid stabilization system protein ParE